MDTSSGDSTPTKQSKMSTGRASLPRRSARGPLDISQGPVSASPSSSPSNSQILPSLASNRPPIALSTYTTAQNFPLSTYTTAQTYPMKEFPKLLRPEIYHPLTHITTPPPFRSSNLQPGPDTPLQTLLEKGHFRAAAVAAAQLLTTNTSPSNHQSIFSLLYIRLACLILCGSTALAAQEATALEDLSSSVYRDEGTGVHLVPWELRVLAVRLQGVGFQDPRKGVMAYYDLARQARAEVTKLKGKYGTEEVAERKMWEARLADLGIRVASALVEMQDLDGATHHMKMLSTSSTSTQAQHLNLQRAILWLRIGDLEAAQRCVSENEQNAEVVVALSEMASGRYVEAVGAWKALCEKDSGSSMYQQNLAVCLLYAGELDEARSILEALVGKGDAFHTLTFNLCTIYELCTDKSRTLKLNLAEKVASLPDSNGLGWDKSVLDFKL